MSESLELGTLSLELKQHWGARELSSFLEDVYSFYALSLNLIAGRPPNSGWSKGATFPSPWDSVPDGYPSLMIARIHINSPGSLDLVGLGKAMEQIRLFLNSVGSAIDRHVLSRKDRLLQLQKLEHENKVAQFELQKAQELHKQDLEERALAHEEKKLDLEKKKALQKLETDSEIKKLRGEITQAVMDQRLQKEAYDAMLESFPFLKDSIVGDKTLLPSIHPMMMPLNPNAISPGPGQGPTVAQYLQAPLTIKLIIFMRLLGWGDLKVADGKDASAS